MKRRILNVITALALCLSLCPTWAFAAETDSALSRHHPAHTGDCGYIAPTEGQHSHNEECGHVQADPGQPYGFVCPICPIEALIAALPDEVTPDNANDVRGQLDEILALFSVLAEAEQEQIDLFRAYELQAVLDTAKAPITADEIPEGAVAKVEKEGAETVYVTADKLDAAFAENSSYADATFTLLADVERTKAPIIRIDCILDLGEHTICCNHSQVCLNVLCDDTGVPFHVAI